MKVLFRHKCVTQLKSLSSLCDGTWCCSVVYLYTVFCMLFLPLTLYPALKQSFCLFFLPSISSLKASIKQLNEREKWGFIGQISAWCSQSICSYMRVFTVSSCSYLRARDNKQKSPRLLPSSTQIARKSRK